MDRSEEEILVEGLLKDDARSISLLVKAFQGPLQNFIFRFCGNYEDARDIAQETFLRFVRNARNFDPRFRVSTWLFSVARRLCLNHMRRKSPVPSDTLEMLEVESSVANPALRLEAEEALVLRRKLWREVQKLAEPQKTALLLFYQQGMPIAEMATVMEMPIGTVKSHLHRARAKLRKALCRLDIEKEVS